MELKATKEIEETDAKVEQNSADDRKKVPGMKKLMLVLASIMMIILVIIYIVFAFYFSKHFYPNTEINGIDAGKRDMRYISERIQQEINGYQLEVMGRTGTNRDEDALITTIRGDQIGLCYQDTDRQIDQFLNMQNVWMWPIKMIRKQSVSHVLVVVKWDEDRLDELLKELPEFNRNNMVAGRDAYISDYDGNTKSYHIVADTVGTLLDTEQAKECINLAVASLSDKISLYDEECYKRAYVTAEDKYLNKRVSMANQYLQSEIDIDWNGTPVKVDADLISQWITFAGDSVELDEQLCRDFVKKQAALYDTYGLSTEFTTALGKTLNLKRRNFGWKTDIDEETAELIELIRNGEKITREPVYAYNGMEKGQNDIGDSYVECDLSNQHIYVIQDGTIVLESDFVSGTLSSTPDCVTPQGIFGLLYKTQDAVLKGATYRTKVNYWMPFFGNYGMHDATWRRAFGGDIFITGGSHGCINLPLSFARELYEYVSKGSPVICYYYEADPLQRKRDLEQQIPPAAETDTPATEELIAE